MAEAERVGDEQEADPVAAYKAILRKVLDARPSGTRQRIAAALAKNRSFVSQITNPAYSTPIPARHVDLILEICHFSPAERAAFLEAYTVAHPQRLSLVGGRPMLRPHTVYLPELDDPEKNRKMDALVSDFVQRLADLMTDSNPAEPPPRKSRQSARSSKGVSGQ